MLLNDRARTSYSFINPMTGLFLILLLSGLLVGCDDKAVVKKRSPASLPAVEVAKAELQSLNHRITVTGTLESKRTVRIYNQAQGMLMELPFHEGDSIKQGELLARLDDTIIKAEYDKAEATFKQSRLDYSRLEKLAPTNMTSKELLTRGKTKVTLDQAEYNLQKKRLSYTRIQAPWEGVVSERLAEPGDVLPMHTHFLSLIDTSSLIVKVALSELYLSKFKPGDPISFMIDALGRQNWTGNVLRIYPNVNSQTRKGIMEVNLSPAPQGAKPGQLTRINLLTPKRQVLVIPLSAIRYDQQGAYVFIIKEDNKIKRRKIITGEKFPLYMEILEGLEVGDTIVEKGLFGLRSGKKVKILNAAKKQQ